MINKIKYLSSRPHICSTDSESKTRPNLAYTPAQMADMVARGLPVSSFVESSFNDGSSSTTFDDLPIEHTRGIDINDVWNAQQDSRHKFAQANKSDISNFGK